MNNKIKLITCLSLLSLQAVAIDVRVGTDNTCTYNNIQTAINAATGPGPHTITVTNQQIWTGNLLISGKQNLKLVGQLEDCRHSNFSDQHTVVDAGLNTPPVININSSTQIVLQGFQVSNAQVNGGISVINSTAGLIDMKISNNKRNVTLTGVGAAGGGLSLFNQSNVLVVNTEVVANQARNGGGIACHDSKLTLYNSLIQYNQTIGTNDDLDYGKGGGIYASQACELQINSFKQTPSTQPFEISNNQASYSGAGLYADGASEVEINHVDLGYQPLPLLVSDNFISYTGQQYSPTGGAGIAAIGQNTVVDGYHMIIKGNTIDQSNVGFGAAILLDEAAEFIMKVRKPPDQCTPILGLQSTSCNQIINNSTTNPFYGIAGMIYMGIDSSAQIYQSHIAGNFASKTQLGYLLGYNQLQMQGNVVVNNGQSDSLEESELFQIGGFSDFRADFSTFADNYLFSGALARGQMANLVAITRSIIDEGPNTLVFQEGNPSNPSSTFFRCLLTHEDSSVVGQDIVVGSPQYQSTWPYHLAENSPGVNMCNHSQGDLMVENDVDGDTRGQCSGNCPEYRFDAGADEYRITDLIFENDFD